METNTNTIPAAGDPWTFTSHHGYRLVQERPYECRRLCRCGECNGTTVSSVETVTEVIRWADNAIEVVGHKGSRCEIVAPHGDACF